MQEIGGAWWCMHIAHAQWHTHHAQNAPDRILPHQRGFVKYVIFCGLGLATTQTPSKINIMCTVLSGRYGPKIRITTPTFFVKFRFCGWHWVIQ